MVVGCSHRRLLRPYCMDSYQENYVQNCFKFHVWKTPCLICLPYKTERLSGILLFVLYGGYRSVSPSFQILNLSYECSIHQKYIQVKNYFPLGFLNISVSISLYSFCSYASRICFFLAMAPESTSLLSSSFMISLIIFSFTLKFW